MTRDGDAIRQPRLGAIGWARWAWRQLTSMRTALLLLLLLAVAAVPGSVLPQRRIDPAAVAGYLADHPAAGPWLDRLGGFDVYASPWFSAIYLLLFISLVGCVLPRSRQHLSAIRAAPPRTPRRLERMPVHRAATSAAPPAIVLQAAGTALRSRRYRVARYDEVARHDEAPGSGAISLAGERGQLRETGNLAFHLALLGVLVAVAVGSLFGWSGQTVVITGQEFANTLPRYTSFTAGSRVDPGNLPAFSIGLSDLRVTFEERDTGNQFGAPRDFRADLSVQDSPGAAPRTHRLRVNEPLTVQGARVFLVGNGYAVQVSVRDGTGRRVFAGQVPMLVMDGDYTSSGAIKVPDASPQQLGFVTLLLPTAAVNQRGQPISVFPDARNPRLVLRAFTGDLGLDDGVPESVYTLDLSGLEPVPQDGRAFGAVLAVGQSATLPSGLGSITFEGVTRYAALDIRYDPSKRWVLAASLLALAGLVLSLFVRRRRVWVRVRPGPDGVGSLVEVAGLARGEDPGLAGQVEEILREVLGAPVAATHPGADAAPGTGEDRAGGASSTISVDDEVPAGARSARGTE